MSAEVRRVLEGVDANGDYSEIEFSVDEAGEVWVRDVTDDYEDDRVFIPRETFNAFVGLHDRLWAAALDVEGLDTVDDYL